MAFSRYCCELVVSSSVAAGCTTSQFTYYTSETQLATKQTPAGAGAEKPEEIGLWPMALLGVPDLSLRQWAGNWSLLFQVVERRLQAFVGAVLGACMSVALVCKQACWFLACGVAAAGADPEPTSIFYSPRSSRSKRPTVRRTSLTLHIGMPRTYCLSTQARARATEASQPEF